MLIKLCLSILLQPQLQCLDLLELSQIRSIATSNWFVSPSASPHATNGVCLPSAYKVYVWLNRFFTITRLRCLSRVSCSTQKLFTIKCARRRRRQTLSSLADVRGATRFGKPVYVMLGAVFRDGHFEDKCNAQKRFLRIAVGNNLKDSEVFQNGVHHVLLRQILQFVDEINHVLAHCRAIQSIHKSAVLERGKLRLRRRNKRRVWVHKASLRTKGNPPPVSQPRVCRSCKPWSNTTEPYCPSTQRAN